MRFWLAIRAFWSVLLNAQVGAAVERVLAAPAAAEPTQVEPEDIVASRQPTKPAPSQPARSDAVTLLAALQREARFVDIVKEPLTGYSDQQVGAAVRDVLRDCGTVLERMFALQPIATQAEGESIPVPKNYDPGQYELSGNVSGQPESGRLVHPGWRATRCDLPTWSGSKQSALVIAPVELEVGS